MLKALRRGAKLYVVDPRRTASAQWADVWLGTEVGSDIALANAMGREIIAAGLANREFIGRATSHYEEYVESVQPYTLECCERITGVPAEVIRQFAHEYARSDRAQLCWTLGITEHHNATDNVLALINLVLLTGHVGRYGSGLCPLRGQNNVQGGGDMGAIPARLPGFQDVEDSAVRGRFQMRWNAIIPDRHGWHLSEMFEAMERGDLTSLYVIGENPAQSEADSAHASRLLLELEHLVVQDIFLTKTAELASVVLPASVAWAESEGTVTSSERRVQRCRAALRPPSGARDDIWTISELARRMGHDWANPTAEAVWDELRELSPMHAGMTYARLEANGGLQWPCYTEDDPGELFLHGRLWQNPRVGPPAPFTPVVYESPIDELSDEFPMRLTTGRRLDSFNTGVQTEGYRSPLRKPETINVSLDDAVRLGLQEADVARVRSRRGEITVPVHVDSTLRPGLAFMTLHFPDQVETNILTNDVWDPKSGTAEFKATAVSIEKVAAGAESPSVLVTTGQ